MRLSARPIINYLNVNSFSYANQWIVRSGDPNTLYFQIVDLDQGPAARYMVGLSAASSINVVFPSIDDSEIITLIAIQDTNDKSIWSVSIPATQTPGSGNVQFAVAEGSSIRRFSSLNLINVEIMDDGSC